MHTACKHVSTPMISLFLFLLCTKCQVQHHTNITPIASTTASRANTFCMGRRWAGCSGCYSYSRPIAISCSSRQKLNVPAISHFGGCHCRIYPPHVDLQPSPVLGSQPPLRHHTYCASHPPVSKSRLSLPLVVRQSEAPENACIPVRVAPVQLPSVVQRNAPLESCLRIWGPHQ